MIFGKKEPLYKYSAEIYPRKLFVYLGQDKEFLNDNFRYEEDPDARLPLDAKCPGETYPLLEERATGDYGILVRIDPKQVNTEYIAHESGHAVFEILSSLGSNPTTEDQGPFCYLLGWVAKKITESIERYSGK